MDAYLGEIRLFPYTFAPLDWGYCDGQQVPIMQFQGLYAVIGNSYGSPSQSSFFLPDLQGRAVAGAVVGSGTVPGLTPYTVGQSVGVNTVTLANGQMPNHSHAVQALDANGDTGTPTDALLAKPSVQVGPIRQNVPIYAPPPPSDALAPTALAPVGGNLPHTNQQPALGLGFCICMDGGDFPPHS